MRGAPHKTEPAAAQKQAQWSKKMRVATSDSDGDDPHPPHSRPSIRTASPYARRPQHSIGTQWSRLVHHAERLIRLD
jgi:hypothetical protein